jgi:Na+-transporting NADH:ubiquinone oxidoreductase subunit C
VNEAKDKVLGTYFYHESETAGLGARIGEKWFQDQFIGKPIFGEDGNVALTVTKAGAAQSEYEVDGVTGATLTSNGVAAMVKDGLTVYKEFLGAAASEPEAEPVAEPEAEESEETNVEQ